MSRLNSLPVVVDGIGKYVSRSGRLVEVDAIKSITDNPEHTEFAVKGTWYKKAKTGKLVGTYNIWHVSGRISVFTESPLDIISKV